jgi:hypothetical protein
MGRIYKKRKNQYTVKISASSPLAEALRKLAIHNRLRTQYYRGDISLEQFNGLLRENKINKQYESSPNLQLQEA